jgi:hypothetical protein
VGGSALLRRHRSKRARTLPPQLRPVRRHRQPRIPPQQQAVTPCRRWVVEDATGRARANGSSPSEDCDSGCRGTADLESNGQRSRRLRCPTEPAGGEEAEDQRSEPTVSPRRNAGRVLRGQHDIIGHESVGLVALPRSLLSNGQGVRSIVVNGFSTSAVCHVPAGFSTAARTSTSYAQVPPQRPG